MTDAGPHLVLYDGTCGLCHGFVQWVLSRDSGGAFHFAALQSDFAKHATAPCGLAPKDLNTVIVIPNYRLSSDSSAPSGPTARRCLTRSRAALFVTNKVGWPWRAFGALHVLPTSWLDAGYDLVARYRYRVFGRRDACVLPTPTQRARFVDDDPGT